MLTYEDGTRATVGDVVIEAGRPERYITVGFEGNAAKLLTIGTIVKEDSPLNGKTIILPTGVTRSVPLSVLRCLGYAEITIGKDSAPDDAVHTK